ncbi:MAG: SurA N-terminal domain-containing protein [Kofleriaceae bacterium]
MLQSIREKTSGWIASFMLGLIIILMAFFGVGDYLSPKIETFAAKIESAPKMLGFGSKVREVSVDEFRRRFEQVREQQREAQGDKFDAAAFEQVDNKRLVLDQLIDEAVLELVAERGGIAVSRAQLQKTIADIPSFQVGGKFDKDQYVLALQTRGQTPAQFEQLIRTSLVQQLVPTEIADSALAGDAELESFLRMSQQTRHVRFLEVPPPIDLPAAPAEADVKAWYDAHAARYRNPERVVVDYLELDGSTLPPAAAPDEKALRDVYERDKVRYGAPEQRIASHIMVQVDEKAPASAWDTALAKARDIAAKARAPGADFAALAHQFSDDVATKDTGGDLGAIEKDTLGADFGAALYALQPGQVSDPVRTTSGWSVIQFRQLVPATTKPFEEVRAQIASEYQDNERERAFGDASSALIDAVYASPTSLATVGQKVKRPVLRSTAFSRIQGDGIGALEPVRKAAFEDDQKVARQVSEPVEIAPDHVVVLQVVDVQPEAPQPLAQIHDRVVSDLQADRIAAATKARAEKLLARAKAGETLETLATEVGRQLADVPKMGRNAPGAQFAPLVDAAFELPRPAADKEQLALAHLASGEFALVGVVSVEDGDPTTVDAETRKALRGQLAKARGIEDARAFVRALRKQYTITVAEDRL